MEQIPGSKSSLLKIELVGGKISVLIRENFEEICAAHTFFNLFSDSKQISCCPQWYR